MNEENTVQTMDDEALQVSAATNDITAARRDFKLATSIPIDTPEAKAKLYNALQNPSESVSDNVGTVIELTDYICQPVYLKNDETGEMEPAVRVILIDAYGKSYTCCSAGVRNSLEMLCMLYGPMELWGAPLNVRVVQQQLGKNRLFKLEIVE